MKLTKGYSEVLTLWRTWGTVDVMTATVQQRRKSLPIGSTANWIHIMLRQSHFVYVLPTPRGRGIAPI